MSEKSKFDMIDCPKCGAAMRPLKTSEVIIDRCEKCFGVWLDKGERQKLLKDKSLVAGLDIGSEEVGRRQDEITEITCPRCEEPMQHVTDVAQKHIGYELCRSCEGCFFDAGELRDLSKFTLSERVRALFGR